MLKKLFYFITYLLIVWYLRYNLLCSYINKFNLFLLGILQVATYPFGNTLEEKFSNGTLTLKCKRAGECQRNTKIACIMDKVQYEVEKYLPTVDCYLRNDNLSRCLNETLPEVTYDFVKNCSIVKYFVLLKFFFNLNMFVLMPIIPSLQLRISFLFYCRVNLDSILLIKSLARGTL